jgi:phospholipase C
MAEDAEVTQLARVDHIVVLMMENRSFDHMLGYLSLEGGRTDVDGIPADFANEYAGRRWPVHHLTDTAVADDPDHSAAAVDRQIGDGQMDGFVTDYAETLRARDVADHDPGAVMGYYGAADVPVYDHLAAQFVVCDRWFSSVPGATWPNRLYALCGRAAGSRDDRPHHEPPLYNQPSFVRHLDAHGVSWRWYSIAVGSLRMADGRYSLGHHDHFAYLTKTGLNWNRVLNARVDAAEATFFEDAAAGRLPAVSWIDPSFSNFNMFGVPPNDDHAPADITDGQDLALAVYHALATGPQWDRMLLLICYDEHGGFFDHVPPPQAPDDDPAHFGRYGVRVPALVVSPWVEPGAVAKTLFDHTSIVKTILLRFCPSDLSRPDQREGFWSWLHVGHPNYVGARVAAANHLGGLLTRSTARPAQPHAPLVRAARARAAERAKRGASPTEHPPTDLQLRIAALTRELERLGHLHGRP